MLIKNGTIITPGGEKQVDILVEGQKISAITDAGVASSGPCSIEIDASGHYLLPGGVDPHVHLHLPTSAGCSSDDFLSGSLAALHGGTTTLIDFVTPHKGQPLPEALELRKIEAQHCLTDYTFHVSPVAWHHNLPAQIRACIDQGISSFKVYMAYKDAIGLDDEILEKVMAAVGEAGGLVVIHCELGDEIEKLRHALFAAGKTGISAHPLSRPPEMESLAVKAAISMAAKTNCPLYIVHVSAKESLKHIRTAQRNGQLVFAEACPHHLLLDDTSYENSFEKGAPYVLSPPLRKMADQEALWEALADGTIQVVATDHCPFMMTQKMKGLHDFRLIANGAGGVEHRLELLYTFGVRQDRISMSRFVELVSANPAKIFGLYPAKGCLQAGADADLVMWNPDVKRLISAGSHHQHCDHNIYEGLQVQGQAAGVIKGGTWVIENGKPITKPTAKFLARKPIMHDMKDVRLL